MLIALLRVEVMANVGPLAQSGLDEAFSLAVGAWCPRFAPRFWALTWATLYPNLSAV